MQQKQAGDCVPSVVTECHQLCCFCQCWTVMNYMTELNDSADIAEGLPLHSDFQSAEANVATL